MATVNAAYLLRCCAEEVASASESYSSPLTN
jgi:hypothetical protein